MNDHIIEFENLYKKINGFEIKRPDPVLVFKLLDGVLALVMMNIN